MAKNELTIDEIHLLQAGSLPDRFGVQVEEVKDGELTLSAIIHPWMMAPNGFLHAASVVLLADTAAGYATLAHLPSDASSFTTIELKSNFLGTAKSGVLRAIATAEHLGRTTQVWSATVLDDAGRKIALFRCTQAILRPQARLPA